MGDDDAAVVLNDVGAMVENAVADIPTQCPGVDLDSFVVMPNHVHIVIVLPDPTVGAGPRARPERVAPALSLSDVVGRFKSWTTHLYSHVGAGFSGRLWQRNFHDRIIRNDAEWNRIREYIRDNPANWMNDEMNPLETNLPETREGFFVISQLSCCFGQ